MSESVLARINELNELQQQILAIVSQYKINNEKADEQLESYLFIPKTIIQTELELLFEKELLAVIDNLLCVTGIPEEIEKLDLKSIISINHAQLSVFIANKVEAEVKKQLDSYGYFRDINLQLATELATSIKSNILKSISHQLNPETSLIKVEIEILPNKDIITFHVNKLITSERLLNSLSSHKELLEISPDNLRDLINRIYLVQGISTIESINKYEITIKKGSLYEWQPITDAITTILIDYLKN